MAALIVMFSPLLKVDFFNKQNQELNEKLLCLVFKFYSYWQGSWSFFDWFQFKGVVLMRSTEPYLICSSDLQPQFVHDGDEQLKKKRLWNN